MVNSTGGTSGGNGAGGGKSNVDLGDEKLKSDEGQEEKVNIPKNAVGNYDPNHAAPGGYDLPPSYGPSAGAGMPAASKETNPDAGSGKEEAGKEEGKVEGNKQDVKDAATTSADKEALTDNKPEQPLHGDAGKTGATPGEKAASVTPNTKPSK